MGPATGQGSVRERAPGRARPGGAGRTSATAAKRDVRRITVPNLCSVRRRCQAVWYPRPPFSSDPRRPGMLPLLPLLAAGAIGSSTFSFHLMMVKEVYPGSDAAPSAQYVVIQMYSAGTEPGERHADPRVRRQRDAGRYVHVPRERQQLAGPGHHPHRDPRGAGLLRGRAGPADDARAAAAGRQGLLPRSAVRLRRHRLRVVGRLRRRRRRAWATRSTCPWASCGASPPGAGWTCADRRPSSMAATTRTTAPTTSGP